MASSLMRVLPGCMLAKYLTSLSMSICRATSVCSRASWCELAECRKYSTGGNTETLKPPSSITSCVTFKRKLRWIASKGALSDYYISLEFHFHLDQLKLLYMCPIQQPLVYLIPDIHKYVCSQQAVLISQSCAHIHPPSPRNKSVNRLALTSLHQALAQGFGQQHTNVGHRVRCQLQQRSQQVLGELIQ